MEGEVGKEKEVKKMGVTAVLVAFFGVKLEEARAMPISERRELAREAAKQLGVELVE